MTDVARPPFDDAVARALAEFDDLVVVSMSSDEIPRVRASGVAAPLAELTAHGAFERDELLVPGWREDDPPVGVVVYTPAVVRRPVPVILHLHGGGLIAGNADSDMPATAELAERTGCAILSVEYRLAPEHPYPAALEDAAAALRWLAGPDAPAALDGDRIIVAGVSAGGGLAAATALFARDHGGPRIAGLVLLCPMLDHRSDSESARQMAGHGSWDRDANATAWAAYLADVEGGVPPYASPAVADSLAGLPPTFIDVGSAETFRDECVAFARRMWADGGDAELHVWPGGAHAFDFLAPWTVLARDARRAREEWLRRLLHRI
ncbi:esterase [Microbacterium sp. AISO3]|uniref:alpha/beta hydrolase fold domain-containing protein n=1 Tax=Microbacterium sp. AISO3 TaxID=2002831 RepID=UPI000B4CA480|nr:alpha/beta hydrolase fold domain-containing protein [Microbacterium sp. AISO3]OWP23253.1 esterase [Microbacterium sp. AISO3]